MSNMISNDYCIFIHLCVWLCSFLFNLMLQFKSIQSKPITLDLHSRFSCWMRLQLTWMLLLEWIYWNSSRKNVSRYSLALYIWMLKHTEYKCGKTAFWQLKQVILKKYKMSLMFSFYETKNILYIFPICLLMYS
jgi:hypothetical protein